MKVYFRYLKLLNSFLAQCLDRGTTSKCFRCAGRTCLSPRRYKPDIMMKHAIYRKSYIEMDASCAYSLHPLFIKWINLLRLKSVYSYPTIGVPLPRSVIAWRLHPTMETGQWTGGRNMTSLWLDVQMCSTWKAKNARIHFWFRDLSDMVPDILPPI